jgi:hypothetical protein
LVEIYSKPGEGNGGMRNLMDVLQSFLRNKGGSRGITKNFGRII